MQWLSEIHSDDLQEIWYVHVQGVPQIHKNPLCSPPITRFYLIYSQVWKFCISWVFRTVSLTQTLCTAVSFKPRNQHKAGTLCMVILNLKIILVILGFRDKSKMACVASWQEWWWYFLEQWASIVFMLPSSKFCVVQLEFQNCKKTLFQTMLPFDAAGLVPSSIWSHIFIFLSTFAKDWWDFHVFYNISFFSM